MTGIMLRWVVIFIAGGLVLVTANSTASSFAEKDSTPSSNLTTTSLSIDNSSTIEDTTFVSLPNRTKDERDSSSTKFELSNSTEDADNGTILSHNSTLNTDSQEESKHSNVNSTDAEERFVSSNATNDADVISKSENESDSSNSDMKQSHESSVDSSQKSDSQVMKKAVMNSPSMSRRSTKKRSANSPSVSGSLMASTPEFYSEDTSIKSPAASTQDDRNESSSEQDSSKSEIEHSYDSKNTDSTDDSDIDYSVTSPSSYFIFPSHPSDMMASFGDASEVEIANTATFHAEEDASTTHKVIGKDILKELRDPEAAAALIRPRKPSSELEREVPHIIKVNNPSAVIETSQPKRPLEMYEEKPTQILPEASSIVDGKIPISGPPRIEEYNPLNNIEYMDDGYPGVTFDPDGMTHNGTQDPDSIVFITKSHEDSSTHASNGDDSDTEFEHVDRNGESNSTSLAKDSTMEKIVYIGFNKDVEGKDILNNQSSAPMLLPVGLPVENSSEEFTILDPSKWILPSVSSTPNHLSDESEEMIMDAPHFHEVEPSLRPEMEENHPHIEENVPVSNTDEKKDHGVLHEDIADEIPKESIISTEVAVSSSSESHSTDIRPVEIHSQSPVLISTLRSDSSQQSSPSSSESMTTTVQSDPSTALPNPVPHLAQDDRKELAESTSIASPAIIEVASQSPEVTVESHSSDSTIAGVAVKTSVSVNLPLNNTDQIGTQQPDDGSSKIVGTVPVPDHPATVQNTSESSPSVATESPPVSTVPSSTPSEGVKILKPKIRIPGGSSADSETRTRKPFTAPPLKKGLTTAGPAVSIFGKARTRLSSITSSTTPRAPGRYATLRIHYASDIPGLVPEELIIATDATTTTEAPTTTEEPIQEVPFTDPTQVPSVVNEDEVTLIKVAGYIVIDRGLRWNEQLNNRHSPEYRKKADMMHMHLDRLFRSSPVASRLWKVEIDGFSGSRGVRPVIVDFFLYLIKSDEKLIGTDHLTSVFHEKLTPNNTFARFRVDPSRTAFEMVKEEPLKQPPPPSEDKVEPPIPQWAIAVIVIGAASLIFIVLFAAVTMYGRHHVRRRYSNKLSEDDTERSSGEWESKMAAAYENMAADTLYEADDLRGDTYKKSYILD